MSPMVGSRLSITEEHDPSLLVYADDTRLYQTVRGLQEGGRKCACALRQLTGLHGGVGEPADTGGFDGRQ